MVLMFYTHMHTYAHTYCVDVLYIHTYLIDIDIFTYTLSNMMQYLIWL